MRIFRGFILCGFALPICVCGQSNFYYPNFFNAYYQNMAQITPAYVPVDGKAEFTSGYKSMVGAFRKISSYYFGASRSFKNQSEQTHLLRLQFYNEREGSYISSPRTYANYAYLIPIGEESYLSSGLAMGMAGIYYSASTTTQTSFFLPDGSAGLGIKLRWLELGASAMQLFNSSFTPVGNPLTMKRYYHFHVSAQKKWPNEWVLKGYLLQRNLPSVAQEFFLGSSVSYRDNITFGASVKYKAGMSFFTILGLDTKDDKIQIMLNYNSPLFSLVPAWQSNLEVGLNYILN